MTEIKDTRTVKELSFDYYETTMSNFLVSLYGLEPENAFKQISDEINPIYWIIGHCATHLDNVFNFQCQDKRQCNEEQLKFFGYGVQKEKIVKEKPISFVDLLDLFISIYEGSLEYLKKLPEEKYRLLPESNEKPWEEPVTEGIRRVVLHLMGHMGQITTIRRNLGNPVPMGFVAGMKTESREKIYENWTKWWSENKDNFS